MNDNRSNRYLPNDQLDFAFDEHTRSVDEFFELLKDMRDSLRIVSDSDTSTLFRGQANHMWGLVPGICRGNWIEKVAKCIPPDFHPSGSNRFHRSYTGTKTLTEIAAIEHAAVLAFIHYCDESGIHLPGYSPAMQKQMFLGRETAEQACSQKESPTGWTDTDRFDALIALAQHYGIPTRFLDFTFSPYVAAFFAAYHNLMDTKKHSDDIAVWGVATGKDSHYLRSLGWRLVQVPKQANERMRVQQAAFVATKYERIQNLNDGYGLESAAHDAGLSSTMLGRVTMSSGFTPRVLSELDELGISSRTMMPGYEGVLNDLKLKAGIFRD